MLVYLYRAYTIHGYRKNPAEKSMLHITCEAWRIGCVFAGKTKTIIIIRSCSVQEENDEKDEENESEAEESEEPLDLSWPDTCRARLFYIVLAPILFPLAFSTPDVRRPVRVLLSSC